MILLCGGWAFEACNSREKISENYVGPLTYAISVKRLKQSNGGREIWDFKYHKFLLRYLKTKREWNFLPVLTTCGPGSSVGIGRPGSSFGTGGPGSVVFIAAGYGLDGPGIESRCGGRDFSHLSSPALGPTQPPVQWVRGLSWGKERRRSDDDPSPPSSAVVMKE